jgi:hypothetical protein
MQFTVGLAFGVGVPGIISFVSERVLWIVVEEKSELEPFHNITVSTPIAYACCSSSVTKSGFEYGVCAPYVSYGRGHPVFGDRISVFIPLVCGFQMTARGAAGASIHIPLMSPFFRLGITVLVTHPRIAPISTAVLSRVDEMVQSARGWWRRRARLQLGSTSQP